MLLPVRYVLRSLMATLTILQSNPRSALGGVISLQVERFEGMNAELTDQGTVPPGGACATDSECGGYPYAICVNRTCKCADDGVNTGSVCVQSGTGTERDLCPAGQTYVSEAGICMNTAPPGAPCQYTQQCSGSEVGAFCVGQKCRCVYGMIITGDGKCTFENANCTQRGTIWISEIGLCKAVVPPGSYQQCSHRQQCEASYKDSHCFLNHCTCPPERPLPVDGTCGRSCSNGETFSGVLGKCIETAQPGGSCHYSSQCSAVHPGMICEQRMCRCPQGMVYTGSQCATVCPNGYFKNPRTGFCRADCNGEQVEFEGDCYKKCVPGDRCQVNQQCQGGSTCNGNICVCPRGLEARDGSCQRVESPPGGPCGNGETCVGDSYCENNVCKCQAGTVVFENRCVTPITVNPGQRCSELYVCGGGSRCENGICNCPGEHIIRADECIRAPRVPPGSSCAQGEICTGRSRCEGGRCACPPDEVIRETQCVLPSRVIPGERCLEGDICLGGSNCYDGRCTCGTGMVVRDQQCVEPRQLAPGEYCLGTDICLGGSRCAVDRCTCDSGHVIRDHTCVIPNEVVPGGVCAAGDNCLGDSVCKEGICCCLNEMIARSDRCIVAPQIYPGGRCLEGDICMGGSSCYSSICTCGDGLVIQGQLCVEPKQIPPSEYCAASDICIGGSQCRGDTCTCDAGYVIRDYTCVMPNQVPPGKPCLNGDICTGGSSCVSGTCVCSTGLIIKFDECIEPPRVPPGGACAYGEICTGGSTCSAAGICECMLKYIIKQDTCVLEVAPGSPCTHGEICTGGSTCSAAGICECMLKYIIKQDTCVLQVPPGSPCTHGEICTGGSTCSAAGICECMLKYIIKQDTCVLQVPPGASCANGELCSGGSFCQSYVCSCSPGMVIRSQQCMKPLNAAPGESCKNGEICTGGSACGLASFMCDCPAGMIIQSGRCTERPVAPPGFPCTSMDVCTGGSICLGGICACNPGLVPLAGYCQIPVRIPPGSPCTSGVHICSGGSSCTGGVCQCPGGMIARAQVCQPMAPLPSINVARSELRNCPLPQNPSACQLPNCFCSRTGLVIPGGLDRKDTPQMVVLTFDDAVNDKTINIYKSLFDGRYKNPNRCPIKGTFIVSHEWNNYDDSQWLYWQGHEMAVNSITHETMSNEPVERWTAELEGMRTLLKDQSFVESSSIKGMRAPQIAIGGNNQYEMMKAQGFLYDNSMSANPGKAGPPFWPQTLDYKISWKCEIEPCPTNAFPGVWEVPINQFYGYHIPEIDDYKRGAMVRAVMKAEDDQETVYKILMDNFKRAYDTNRAPYVVTLNADFLVVLEKNQSVHALEQFLGEVLKIPDVYVVTMQQAIEWMQSPTRIGDISRFGSWQCPSMHNSRAAPCQNARRCGYDTELPTGKHYFTTCGECPVSYPWLYNPQGTLP